MVGAGVPRLNAITVEVPDSYTLIPEDQSAKLAAHIRVFESGRPDSNALAIEPPGLSV
jgi:hypothetical protein